MKRLAKYVVTFAAAALMSSSAFATINFSDNFESYTLYEGQPVVAIGGGWLYWANVTGPGDPCPNWNAYWYGYGGEAPNSGEAFSNISLGNTGQALNVFTDYANGNQTDGSNACIETSVYQETVLGSGDTGSYAFRFRTQVQQELGPNTVTFGFIKVINPDNSLAWFESFDTATAGVGSVLVTLDESAEGKKLQWGFTTITSNAEPSGRLYDNVSFSLNNTGAYEGEEGVPIPLWALIFMGGLLALVGGSRLRRRRS